MVSVSEFSHLIKDGAAALTGQADPEAKMRLARSVLGIVAPEYAPAVDGVARLANHLGVKLTSEGLDIDGLRSILTGEPPAESGAGAREPWATFIPKMRHLRSGVVLILGPRGSGKSTLAVRLAEAWRREHGYSVLAVNMYREDLRPWITMRPIEVFGRAMEDLTEALNEGQEPPTEICRRVVLIDEASLSLHPGGARKGILAVERAIRQARHLQWLIVVIAHLTVDLPVQMAWCDAIFVKEPSGDEAQLDRDTSEDLWQAASVKYKQLHREGLRGKPIQGWVYAHAPELDYRGMMPYGVAGEEDPHPGPVRRLDPSEVPE